MNTMDIQVFDTYVQGSKGTMHFDVYLEKGKTIHDALDGAKKYLVSVGEEKAKITAEECSFCHIQNAQPDQEKAIKTDGYFILKMSGCP